MESALRPRVIVGVGGHGAHRRLVRTAVSLARARGGVLYAVDVRDDDPRGSTSGSRPPQMQDAYLALSRAGGLPDDVDVRIVVARGEPGATLARLADLPDDLLVLGRSRQHRAATPDPGQIAWRCAAAARCSVVIVPPDPSGQPVEAG